MKKRKKKLTILKSPCGKSAYFDLQSYFFSSTYRNNWEKVCPSKDNLSQWFKSQVDAAGDKIDGNARIGRKGRRNYVKEKLEDLLKVFKIIQDKFEHICQGGKKLTNTDIYVLNQLLEKELDKRMWSLKGLFVKDFKKKIRQEAKDIFKRFTDKIRGKSFDYCACEPFFKLGSSSQYSTYKSKLAQECNSKCSAGVVTEEIIEIIE